MEEIYMVLRDKSIHSTEEQLERDVVWEIALKWYIRLNFPKEYDVLFHELLKEAETLEPVSVAEYITTKEEYGKNLIMLLYFCEELSRKYKEKNIPEDILMATLSDLVYWTQIQYELSGELGISYEWPMYHLSFRLFRIGRLQFCFDKSRYDAAGVNLKKGDNIIDVHIPAGTTFAYEDCLEAFERAEQFFKEYFPEYEYEFFSCQSWLLDDTLLQFLSKDSNIAKFQSMYIPYEKEYSLSLLHYIFGWHVSKENIAEANAHSSLAQKVKKYVLNGGSFYEVCGYRSKGLRRTAAIPE